VLWFATLELLCLLVALILLLTPITCPFMLAYFVWIYFDKAPHSEGRRWEPFRHWSLFHHLRDYFPTSLHKTAELPPDKTYVFGYHPHGIISVGAFTNFATEATGFSQVFPGITLSLLTLSVNFKVPFFREYIMALGVCDVGNVSCDNILQKGPGNAIMIVVGGAAEALDSHPGSYDLVLARRKGFVRVALENGASLVPVISYGETDVFDQVPNPEGSPLRNFQNSLQKKLGFSMPFFHGRGIFNYDFGLLPHRCPIDVFVGDAIDCPKTDPKNEELLHSRVDEYHTIYCKKLKQLFEGNKPKSVSEEAEITLK